MSEIAAVRTENIARDALGMATRTHYEWLRVENSFPGYSPLDEGPTPKQEFADR